MLAQHARGTALTPLPEGAGCGGKTLGSLSTNERPYEDTVRQPPANPGDRP